MKKLQCTWVEKCYREPTQATWPSPSVLALGRRGGVVLYSLSVRARR